MRRAVEEDGYDLGLIALLSLDVPGLKRPEGRNEGEKTGRGLGAGAMKANDTIGLQIREEDLHHIFQGESDSITFHGTKHYVHPSEFAVTSDGRLGFLCCFHFVSFDVPEKRIIWVKDNFYPGRTILTLDQARRQVTVERPPNAPPGLARIQITVDYSGKIVATRNASVAPFLQRTYGNAVLASRQSVEV